MAYIQISDPNIIDLAAWHQVINVVNQHSDSIDAITNNFGQNTVTDWAADQIAHLFDPGSQAIIYGRTLIHTVSQTSESNNVTLPSGHGVGKLLYGTVSFTDSGVTFSQTPTVLVTCNSGNVGSGSPGTQNQFALASVYTPGTSGFGYRITIPNSLVSTGAQFAGDIYLNWIAIGPR